MSDRRPTCLGVLTLFLLGLGATQAAAWGPAVHVYVADHAGKIWPSLNRTEMYGATLPDACYFAYDLGPVLQAACAAATHEKYEGSEEIGPWIDIWEAADSWNTRALGFGYVSHNEKWGADRTAHDPVWGYVVVRARLMAVALGEHPLLGTLSFEQREAIAHTVIEAATDLQVKRIDQFIGSKLFFAALLRGSFAPQQYAGVYAEGFGGHAASMGVPLADPAATLVAVEGGFRDAMLIYSIALMQEETQAIRTLAKQFAPLAPYWGVNLPPATVEPLIVDLIEEAIAFTENDFPSALRITTRRVRWNLWLHGVWY
jgi:hypothetical protein